MEASEYRLRVMASELERANAAAELCEARLAAVTEECQRQLRDMQRQLAVSAGRAAAAMQERDAALDSWRREKVAVIDCNAACCASRAGPCL
jgi:hypothetical protein